MEEPKKGGPVRVAIVDDHVLIARGVAALIAAQPSLVHVGTAHRVADAVPLVQATSPDVVLMDFDLPDGNGIDLAKSIKRTHPPIRVLLLTGHTEPSVVARAAHAGCDGFLRKTCTSAELIDAIERAHSGEAAFGTADLQAALDHLRAPAPSRFGLTERELDVLGLIAQGHSTTQMAQSLFVSANTIRTHVRHILEKLGVHSKVEALSVAIREGLLD